MKYLQLLLPIAICITSISCSKQVDDPSHKTLNEYVGVSIKSGETLGICNGLSEEDFNKMIDVSMGMKPLWENALGKDWEQIMTREKLRALYSRL